MPRPAGYKLSEETKKKIGLLAKGRPAWNKGAKGLQKAWNKGLKSLVKPWNTGTKGIVKAWNKGLKGYNAGENNGLWKGGISKRKGYHAHMSGLRRVRKRNNGGFHTMYDWDNLKAQYNWECPCCKVQEPFIKLTKDHIIPITKGGSDNIENIQPLCVSCNSKKKTKTIKYGN